MPKPKRDAKTQAQLMIEAFGEDRARQYVTDAINRDINRKSVADYWFQVRSYFPAPPPPPPSETPLGMVLRWLNESGVKHQVTYVRGHGDRAMVKTVIQIDPMQEKFIQMAASFNSRTSGSQPEDGGA